MNYYSHHIGDYKRDTGHLSLLEHGVYRQLLDLYYLSEEPIPEETDWVIRRLSAKTDEEKAAVLTVLNDFFVLNDGWHHKRCDKEIQDYQAKVDAARTNGKLGGRPKKTDSVISANREESEPKANQEPITNNQEPVKTKNYADPRGDAYTEDFDVAWALYPSRPGSSKREAFKAWNARLKAGAAVAALLAGVRRYAAYVKAMQTEPQFIKQPATFFGPSEFYLSDWTPQARASPGGYESAKDRSRREAAEQLTGRKQNEQRHTIIDINAGADLLG